MKALSLRTLVRIYASVGVGAVIIGGVISAFFAKQPSTFAMWASAYLVLVVGVVQVFFAVAIEKLVRKKVTALAYWVFGLFNAGNALVIAGTALKYVGNNQHVWVTEAGSVLVIVALGLLGWQVRNAQSSRLKVAVYVVIAVLALSSLVGLALGAKH